LAQAALGTNVYVLSSGDATLDAAVRQALVAGGHTATVGVPYTMFDGTQSLAGFGAVYFQANVNWGDGDMPVAGQSALLSFVSGGGGLVTSEWVAWKMGVVQLQTLAPAMAVTPTSSYATSATATYAVVTPNTTMNAGLPAMMVIPLTSFGGTETLLMESPGSVVFYNSTGYGSTVRGVVGRAYGAGRVVNISTTAGIDEVQDASFSRLLSNAFNWTGGGTCYANCDASTAAPVLNVNDFICFQTQFAAGSAYANCDGSTALPVLNVNDFVCFQTRFAGGCP
jgi:hypothetical protein